MATQAEANIEDSDPPLFLRFINLLINDSIFLLDEALSVSEHRILILYFLEILRILGKVTVITKLKIYNTRLLSFADLTMPVLLLHFVLYFSI